jgi:hypothetical protein
MGCMRRAKHAPCRRPAPGPPKARIDFRWGAKGLAIPFTRGPETPALPRVAGPILFWPQIGRASRFESGRRVRLGRSSA